MCSACKIQRPQNALAKGGTAEQACDLGMDPLSPDP